MKLIMITGLPGTGKTTFARALSQELTYRHLNTDMVRDELGKRGQYDEETKAEIYEELFKRAESELREGHGVIVDGTFYQRSLRADFEQLAERTEAAVFWIEIKASEEVIEERVNQKRAYSEADFEVYLKIKSQYEPLESPHLTLRSDELEVAKMVDRATAYVNEQL